MHTKGNSFKPNEKLYDRLVVGETVPYVESLRNLYWYFYTFGDFKEPKNTVFSFLSNIPENTIWFGSDSVNGLNIKRYLKTFKILDQKMDDGNYLDGNIRSYCSEKGYNPNVFERRYAVVDNQLDKEKIKVIHIADNKIELNKREE